MNIYVVSQTQQHFIELTGDKFRSLDHHQDIFTQNLKQVPCIFISVINQLDEQNFCFTISFISCLYMFQAHVLIIRRSELHYTASGIITTMGVMIPEAE